MKFCDRIAVLNLLVTAVCASHVSTTYADDWFEYEVPPGFIAPIKLEDGRLFSTDRSLSRLFSEDGGKTWHVSGRIGDSYPVWPFSGALSPNNFCRLRSGAIGMTGWMIDKTKSKDVHGMRTYQSYFTKSLDEGKTWSKPKFFPPSNTPAYATYLIQTQAGRLVVPCEYAFKQAQDTYHDAHQKMSVCTVFYSDDEGETWTESVDSAFVRNQDGSSMHFVEAPTIVETANGQLLMFMRTELQRLAQTYSSDGGVHWGLTKLSPLVSSRSESLLLRLPETNDLLCLWNQAGSKEIQSGYYRSRLSAAVSTDSGSTWKHFQTIIQAPGMAKVTRIVGDTPPAHLRSGGAVPHSAFPALSEDFQSIRAPRASIVDDNVYLVFGHSHYERYALDSDRWKRTSHSTRLRVIPISWFYEAP